MPGAGVLRDRVTFQSVTTTADGQGGNTETYADVCTVRCRLKEQRGREKLEAGRLEQANMATITVRSTKQTRAITTSHIAIIKASNTEFQIRDWTNPDRRNRWIEFLVERGVAR